MTGAPPEGPGGPDPDAGGPLVVDARGTRCPVPVLRLARAVAGLPPGSLATVLATDPAVEHDVPAWAGMRGHAVVALERTGDGWSATVRTG
ncbi:sulfurtransferase TusA family protein [Aquipuribacter hungaricus]|uniref:Sulfurtransferase TusA family protein n=2 Tax=Aquipuribacter hungaricus TaxID=545624 RepID=A0ABV7WFF5_9MICO